MKKIWNRIKNIIRWIPVLWNDRDWDYHYTFEILKTKLKFQSTKLRCRSATNYLYR